MANDAAVHTSGGPVRSSQAVERLRSLTDTDVTLTTHDGQVTGSVLSCTRASVWLVGGDDADLVVPVDEIIDVVERAAGIHAIDPLPASS